MKTVDIIIRSTQGAESLVKGYEVKLSQEEAVPADLAAIQSHRAALQVGAFGFSSSVLPVFLLNLDCGTFSLPWSIFGGFCAAGVRALIAL